jgi:hypothetical protein
MSSFDQVPYSSESNFAAAEFADNPEPRCPCLLLLDNSGSMARRPISELNAGLTLFKEEFVVAASPSGSMLYLPARPETG